VEVVYTDVNPKAYPMAERAVLAHLEKLIEDNLVSITPDGGYIADDNNPVLGN
jgi:Beta-lactamase associated winged helix domain